MNDKCLLFYSPLGAYTLPWEENARDYFTYLDRKGNLGELSVHAIAKDIAWQGGNASREFPFWPHPGLLIIRYTGRGTARFQEKYFENWRTIAEIFNKYNIRLFFELFDFCGTRKSIGQWNPWNIPLAFNEEQPSQSINKGNFFWGPESLWLRKIYIDMMIETFRGLNVGWGICNEPRRPVRVEFLVETFIQLIEADIDPKNIILPIDYRRKEVGKTSFLWSRNAYPKFRDLIAEKLGKEWKKKLKTECISPIHNATMGNIRELWGYPNPDVKPGGDRRTCFSLDGVTNPRPSKEVVYYIFSEILKIKYKSAFQNKIHVEVAKKQKGDPADSMEGASEAYKWFFGEWPVNYHQIKELTPPDDPPDDSPDDPPNDPPGDHLPPAEPVKPKKGKKILTWLKKYWRWVLGLPSFIAGCLIVSLSPSWEWRIGAFLWNFGITYFDFVKK